jgi:hypothetical protein
MQVLKKPDRTAYSDVNFSPALKRALPRLMRLRVEITVSSLSISCAFKPRGKHSSLRLQFEQATLTVFESIGVP